MSTNKHNAENMGAKVRNHTHRRHPYWKRAHRDWRAWLVTVLMLAMILVYVMTDNLSLIPGKRAIQPTAIGNAP